MNSRYDLPALLNSKGLIGLGVEVGVCKGHFASHILKNWKGFKLYLVDSWRHWDGLVDINNPDPVGHMLNLSHTYHSVYEFGRRATIIRDPSNEAAQLFKDESLDFVYIDADHTFEGVTSDLRDWYPKVKKGGIIAGDDYTDQSWSWAGGITHFKVKSAVDQFFKSQVNSTPEREGEIPTWWVMK